MWRITAIAVVVGSMLLAAGCGESLSDEQKEVKALIEQYMPDGQEKDDALANLAEFKGAELAELKKALEHLKSMKELEKLAEEAIKQRDGE